MVPTTRSDMKRFTLIVAASLLVALTAAPVAAAEGGGANKTGDFTPTNPKTTDESNDHGNRPEDGSVGNADDKNPPGQSKNDKNSGYECDKNNGVGKGNPAHSACATSTTVKDTTSTTVKDKTTVTTTKTQVLSEAEQKAAAFEAKAAELKATQVAGVVIEQDTAAVDGEATLAHTGITDWLAPLGTLLVLVGIALVRLGKQPRLI